MGMENKKPEMPTTTSSVKKSVAIGALVIFSVVALAGFLFLLNRDLRWRVADQATGEKKVDMAQIEREYKKAFKSAIESYVNAYDISDKSMGDDFLNKTRQVENEILSLMVPPKFKDAHLTTVLAFGQIVKSGEDKDASAVNIKMDSLRESLKNF